MTAPLPPPPMPGRGAAVRRRGHPAANAGVVLSACSLVPLPVVGGLVGSILGAIGVRAARRRPDLWTPTTGWIAIGIGVALGTLPILVLTLVRSDDWGWVPFGLVLLQVAVVFGIAAGARSAVPGAAGVLGGAGIAIGMVLGLVAFFVLLGELFWEAIFSG